jgi:hypothetical protein
MHTDFLVGTAFYMRFRDWQNRRYTHCAQENKNLRLAGPNRQHIVLIEPVGPSSQVAKLIEQSKAE